MDKNKLNIIYIFIGGMVFGMLALGLLYSQRGLIFKIKDKLETYRVAHIPRKTKVLMINDFETLKDIEGIKRFSSEISLSQDNATSKKHSAKIIFNPSKGASGIAFKNVFEKNKSMRNWEGYDSLVFDIFNPQEHTLRVKFKVKDRGGSSYTTDINLKPGKNDAIFISISQLQGKIKLSKVGQMNIFFWNSNKTNIPEPAAALHLILDGL